MVGLQRVKVRDIRLGGCSDHIDFTCGHFCHCFLVKGCPSMVLWGNALPQYPEIQHSGRRVKPAVGFF